MPRTIVISLVVALILVGGTLIIKHNSSTHAEKSALIATQVNALNQPLITEYAEQLQMMANENSSTTESTTTENYPTINTPSTPSQPLTATDQLSRNLFTQYMSLKESGVDMTNTAVTQQLADNLLSQNYVTGTTTMYTEKNLTIIANPTNQNLVAYGNALGAAISIPLPTRAQSEINIFQTFAETNDDSVLVSLDSDVSRYKKIERALLTTPVPEEFTDAHLTVMNAISQIIHDITVVEGFSTDPVGGEIALTDYPNTVNTLGTALEEEKNLFAQNNVSFGQSDPGYAIVK
ncbi:MAG TPA: hypothetical protein VMR73_00890 [Candidatus Paceibacterota bacterium]|nr:hypothetical protein [Candidatus Paceibacterota bacterium]